MKLSIKKEMIYNFQLSSMVIFNGLFYFVRLTVCIFYCKDKSMSNLNFHYQEEINLFLIVILFNHQN